MPYSQFKHLEVTVSDRTAIVTMNRPAKLNAVDPELHDDLEKIWPVLDGDKDVNVIIFTGAGRAFSAGGDIPDLLDRWGTDRGRERAFSATYRAKQIVERMLSVRKPIIGAINGDAMGLGATLALLCDISVMAETAKLGDTHVRVGLVAGDGGTTIWPLLIGANRAKEFLMKARVVTGKEAAEMGMINHSAPDDQVMEQALKHAKELNRLPPLAVQWSKVSANAILKQQMNLAFDSGIAFEALSMFSHDHKEACLAFVEKRHPVFTGE